VCRHLLLVVFNVVIVVAVTVAVTVVGIRVEVWWGVVFFVRACQLLARLAFPLLVAFFFLAILLRGHGCAARQLSKSVMASKLCLGAAVALLGVATSADAFVIELRSEDELTDAMDSYDNLIVNARDPYSDESREFAQQFHKASKQLLPEIQLASFDRTSEDFQNIVSTLEPGLPVQVYVGAKALSAPFLKPISGSKTADDIVWAAKSVVDKVGARRNAGRNRPAASKREGTPKPKPKPKASEARKQAPKATSATKDAAKPKPKDIKKEKPQPQQAAPTRHSDDDLLVEPPGSRVEVLTTSNFDATVSSSELTLVKFYAPWCGHCKRLAPRFTGASVSLAAEGIKLAKIDQTANREIGARYQVNSFPTLLIFKGSNMVKKYDGGRTQDDIEA